MAHRGNRGGGRIHPSSRTTNDAAAVTATALLPEHAAAIQGTMDLGKSEHVRTNYRSRNREFMSFIHEEYPERYEELTVTLSSEDKNDRSNYYYARDERDLVYEGLDHEIFLAFLSTKKTITKADGQHLASFSHISKFYCAMKWGSSVVNRHLSQNFYGKVDEFMKSYQKEYASGKTSGITKESAADPVNSSLFKLLMTWAVMSGNVFVWCFALMMWHLMARSINIDSICLHNLKRGVSDSIVFKFDDSKTDKTGEFVQEKNCYSNPHAGSEHLCLFTALGCYLSLHQDVLSKTEKLFIKPGSKKSTASKTFGRQIGEIAKRYFDQVKNFVRLSHFSVHGIRKGSGTHASSATTCPPLFTSIAARGEWSMGRVLDVYFQFAQSGDHYLGQLLSLKDPNSLDFDTPCPHWKDPNHPVVLEALHLTFGKILLAHGDTNHDPQSVLSLLMASMVHHSSWMLGVLEKSPRHDFGKLALLNSPLLQELKANHLTMELNEHVPFVTGIPPHVAHMRKLDDVHDTCFDIKNAVVAYGQSLRETVHEAIDEKVENDGGINTTILDRKLNAFEARLIEQLEKVRGTCTTAATNLSVQVGNVNAGDAPIVATANQFQYRGRYWCVPENFDFPKKVDRLNGWRLWLQGKVVVKDGITYRTKPFCKMSCSDFWNKAIATELRTKWRPIFQMMEECPDLEIPQVVDDTFVATSFDKATEYLKTRASYIWEQAKDEGAVRSYSIGTWSRKVARSEIEKHGTIHDNSRLPPKTGRNKEHSRKRTFTIVGDARPDGRIRVNKVPRVTRVAREIAGGDAMAAFANNFNVE